MASRAKCPRCGKRRKLDGSSEAGITFNEPLCSVCRDDLIEGMRNPRDEDYERAAARARSNDFEDTDGRDWT